MDRMDIQIEVPHLSYADLSSTIEGETSQKIRERILKAREIQRERFQDSGLQTNSMMSGKWLKKFATPDASSQVLLEKAMTRLSLSARAYDRILRVSRTLADLEGKEALQSHHVSEAIHYRSLDRRGVESA